MFRDKWLIYCVNVLWFPHKLLTMVLDGGFSLAPLPLNISITLPLLLQFIVPLTNHPIAASHLLSHSLTSPPQPTADCLPPVLVSFPLRPWWRGHKVERDNKGLLPQQCNAMLIESRESSGKVEGAVFQQVIRNPMINVWSEQRCRRFRSDRNYLPTYHSEFGKPAII